MNSLISMLLFASASSASSSASSTLTLRNLVASHRLVALDHDPADRAKQLIAHAGTALFVQQVKANVVVLDGRVKLDRNGDQTKGEDYAQAPGLPVMFRWRAVLDLYDWIPDTATPAEENGIKGVEVSIPMARGYSMK
jgi:hypothetical protein